MCRPVEQAALTLLLTDALPPCMFRLNYPLNPSWINYFSSLSSELKKASKRMSCSKRYKIQKKVKILLHSGLGHYDGGGPCGPAQISYFHMTYYIAACSGCWFTLWYSGLGSGTPQKTEKRGEKERSEQTGEERPWRTEHCSLQRRGPARGRAKEATGLLSCPSLNNFASTTAV